MQIYRLRNNIVKVILAQEISKRITSKVASKLTLKVF